MSDVIAKTVDRVTRVLGDSWSAYSESFTSFISVFIPRFEVGPPDLITYGSSEDMLVLSWDDLDLTLVFDVAGLTGVSHPEDMDRVMLDYFQQCFDESDLLRESSGYGTENNVDMDNLPDGSLPIDPENLVDGFETWGDLYIAIETMADTLVQSQIALEWAERERVGEATPDEMGFALSIDETDLLIGHDKAGVCIDTLGMITEAYSVP